MYEPIVVWPPGTFYFSCSDYGDYYDCTGEWPQFAGTGVVICCPTP